MRALIALTVIMAVLIVAGTSLLGVLIFRRLSAAAVTLPSMALDEPPGTRITGMTGLGDRLVLRLEGGGPDRIILIDPSRALVVGHVGLVR